MYSWKQRVKSELTWIVGLGIGWQHSWVNQERTPLESKELQNRRVEGENIGNYFGYIFRVGYYYAIRHTTSPYIPDTKKRVQVTSLSEWFTSKTEAVRSGWYGVPLDYGSTYCNQGN